MVSLPYNQENYTACAFNDSLGLQHHHDVAFHDVAFPDVAFPDVAIY